MGNHLRDGGDRTGAYSTLISGSLPKPDLQCRFDIAGAEFEIAVQHQFAGSQFVLCRSLEPASMPVKRFETVPRRQPGFEQLLEYTPRHTDHAAILADTNREFDGMRLSAPAGVSRKQKQVHATAPARSAPIRQGPVAPVSRLACTGSKEANAPSPSPDRPAPPMGPRRPRCECSGTLASELCAAREYRSGQKRAPSP